MNPREIAKRITDDPDIFNEMAVTGADVAGGIPVAIGKPLPSRSRKRRKRIGSEDNDEPRKRKVNPSTGQPENPDDEILFSDIPTENPEKPLEEARRTQEEKEKRKEEEKREKIINYFSSMSRRKIYALPVKYLEGGNILGDATLKRGLDDAQATVRRLYISLQEYAILRPSIRDGCKLIEEWSELKKLIKQCVDQKEQKERDPAPPIYQNPPSGWWRVKNWSSSKKNRKFYWNNFLSEVCVSYLRNANKIWKDHEESCYEECYETGHEDFYIDLFCKKLSLKDIWEEHNDNRIQAFAVFKSQIRSKEAPTLSPDEKARWEEYKSLSPEDQSRVRGSVSFLQMFPSVLKSLQNWKSDTSDSSLSKRLGLIEPEAMRKGQWAWTKEGERAIIVRNSPEDEFNVRVVYEKDWDHIFPPENDPRIKMIPKNELRLEGV